MDYDTWAPPLIQCTSAHRDISSLPEQISNPIGRVLLGFIDHDDPDSGFNLMLGEFAPWLSIEYCADYDSCFRRCHETTINRFFCIDSPLAEGFPITAGQVSLTVPDVPARSSYIVARMPPHALVYATSFSHVVDLSSNWQLWQHIS
jgi:hypothetical protein